MTSWKWRHDRFPGVGSYFSTTDILDAGGERIIAAPGQFLYREADEQPGPGGQFGAALHVTIAEVDLGFLRAALQRTVPGRGHGRLHRRV